MSCKYCDFTNTICEGLTWQDEDGDESCISYNGKKYWLRNVAEEDGAISNSANIDCCPKCGRRLTGTDANTDTNKFKDYTDHLAETLEAKNKDYGNSFDKTLDKYGLIALAIRLDDKLSRLISLTKGEEQHVKDESLKDTLQDIAGYAILGMRNLDNEK